MITCIRYNWVAIPFPFNVASQPAPLANRATAKSKHTSRHKAKAADYEKGRAEGCYIMLIRKNSVCSTL